DLLGRLGVRDREGRAVAIEVLVRLLVQSHTLHVFRGPKALVELGAVAEVAQFDLLISAALAGLRVLDANRTPQPALVLDHHPRADRISLDLHILALCETMRMPPCRGGGSYQC